ncbi:TPA: NRAMP family divalent metal transporter [Photobacterium damselae]
MQSIASEVESERNFKSFLQSLGPGIMAATAAIGGSHLVASTKAGAIYGWQLAGVILLVNLLKYPFFRAGVQYTMATGRSLVDGYNALGRGYLIAFFSLTTFAAVVNTAAVVMFTASLLSYFLPISVSITLLSAIVLVISFVILIAGHYKALDSISKIIMMTLVIATVVAAVIAYSNRLTDPIVYQSPSPWTLAALGFMVAMMGWMPAPIEISCLTSIWLINQKKHTNVTRNSALLDFNIGYMTTALLAIVFLALGALILHGSDEPLKTSGIGFSHQLVSMYASTIGEWSRYLIAFVAFACMAGTTLTVLDGYSRAVAEAQRLLQQKSTGHRRTINTWMAIISMIALAILLFFTSSLMAMLDFAMIAAFVTTPIFALLNYRLITSDQIPQEHRISLPLNLLSIFGLIYLFGFLFIFIWWKWLM